MGCFSKNGVMWTLYRYIVLNRELRQKERLSVFVPTLTYDHKLLLVTKRMTLRIQVAVMCFLRRVAGVSLRDGVRSSVIRENRVPAPPLRCSLSVWRSSPAGQRPWLDQDTRHAGETTFLSSVMGFLWNSWRGREVWSSRLLPPMTQTHIRGSLRINGGSFKTFIKQTVTSSVPATPMWRFIYAFIYSDCSDRNEYHVSQQFFSFFFFF